MKPISMVTIAYNEQEFIEQVTRQFYNEIYTRLPNGSEYIIYLDRPTDYTPRILDKLLKELDLKIYHGETNLQYGGAMKNALKKASNNVVFYFDSSGKHNPEDFWKLFEHVDDFDLITGIRKPRTDQIIRRVVSFMQRIFTSIIFFTHFEDYNAGFKLLNQPVLDGALKKCTRLNQSFSSELILRARKSKNSIKTVPVVFKKRDGENTGINIKKLPRIIFKSLKGYFLLRKDLWGKE